MTELVSPKEFSVFKAQLEVVQCSACLRRMTSIKTKQRPVDLLERLILRPPSFCGTV
jgi:hypothetical protein